MNIGRVTINANFFGAVKCWLKLSEDTLIE